MATISYLEYSNRDFRYAEGNLSLGFYDPCGRFCQQTVEKRLKYFIEQNGSSEDQAILYIHNLIKLYDRVCEISGVGKDASIRASLGKLTVYYFDANYPQKGGNIELSEEMAEEALEIARTVNAWVDRLMKGAT